MSGPGTAAAPAARTLSRARWLVVLLQVLLVALILRCAYLQLWRADDFRAKQHRSLLEHERIPSLRGSISTRDGLLLAHDVPVWRVGFDPQRAAGDPSLAPAVREARVREAIRGFGHPDTELRHPLSVLEERAVDALERGRHFLPLGEIDSYARYQGFTRWRRARARAAGHATASCFTASLDLCRHRPHGALALQIIGMTSRDGSGLTGLELQHDAALNGIHGIRALHRWPGHGKVAAGAGVPVLHGDDLVLAIDARVQALLENQLQAVVRERSARGALGIVMDPRDGAIIAMASVPLLDPDTFHRQTEDTRLRRRLQVLHAVLEPGSTFKGFVFAEALLAGLDPEHVITDGERSWRVGSRTIRDASTHGPLTIEESVIHSSNIGMARVGRLLGGARLARCIRRFEFGRRTGIELWDERGISPTERRWRSGTTLSVGFGYEIALTPLQLVRGYCALINGGRLVTPHVVLRDGEAHRDPDPRVIPGWVSRRVRDTLRRAALEGTGRDLGCEAILMAGKSGTAKVAGKGGYLDGQYRSSYLGFAPYQAPRYVTLVLVDRPEGAYFGAAVAGPVVRRLLGTLMGEPDAELRGSIAGVRVNPGPGAPKSPPERAGLEAFPAPSIIPAGTSKGDDQWFAPKAR